MVICFKDSKMKINLKGKNLNTTEECRYLCLLMEYYTESLTRSETTWTLNYILIIKIIFNVLKLSYNDYYYEYKVKHPQRDTVDYTFDIFYHRIVLW